MNLFRKVGEKFEETKRAFEAGRDAAYVCRSCEEPIVEDTDLCPHCGAETVEPAE